MTSAVARDRGPIPVVLFLATASFVLWRLTEIGALVDIAYILNTASRIAAGDVPYSSFRLAHPPVTFAVQAALIRVFGPHYFVQMAYASVVGGVATVLAYGIVRRLLADAVERPRLLAVLLTAPLVPLGIYSIFPHPHYDPDAALAVLVALTAVFAARDRRTPRWWLLAGAALVVPLVIKQNIGGAFLPAALAALGADATTRRGGRSDFTWCLVGVASAIVVAAVSVQIVAGIASYLRWTISYAVSERGVVLERLGWFGDPRTAVLGLALPGIAVLTTRVGMKAGVVAFAGAFGLPLAVVAGINVALLWVPLGIAAGLVAILGAVRRRLELEALLPLICLGTLAGTLMSQGLGGSSFATFPLLVISVASLMRGLARIANARTAQLAGTIVAVLLLVSGTAYSLSGQRMEFADANAPGPVERSTFPPLAGLSARGPYVAELDEVLAWIQLHIPPEDAVTFVPGEDPIYFALGRRPGLPVVQYIDGSLPYSPDELAAIASETELRWVFVKERLQLRGRAPEESLRAGEALIREADPVAVIGPYRVYRRR